MSNCASRTPAAPIDAQQRVIVVVVQTARGLGVDLEVLKHARFLQEDKVSRFCTRLEAAYPVLILGKVLPELVARDGIALMRLGNRKRSDDTRETHVLPTHQGIERDAAVLLALLDVLHIEVAVALSCGKSE
jgi:hypothetical protein